MREILTVGPFVFSTTASVFSVTAAAISGVSSADTPAATCGVADETVASTPVGVLFLDFGQSN